MWCTKQMQNVAQVLHNTNVQYTNMAISYKMHEKVYAMFYLLYTQQNHSFAFFP